MRFHRFSRGGFLTNWGWYNNEEKTLLELERRAGEVIRKLPLLARVHPPSRSLIQRYVAIRMDNHIRVQDMAHTKKTLEDVISGLTRYTNEGIIFYMGMGNEPKAIPRFRNMQENALVDEIRGYLAKRRAMRQNGQLPNDTYVIHWNPTTVGRFDQAILSGERHLYALDEQGFLSIGTGNDVKHSIVAVGKRVLAAGMVQLKEDPRADPYGAMLELRQKAIRNRTLYVQTQDTLYRDYAADLDRQALELEEVLGGWVPPLPQHKERKVILDFDSGHYRPSGARYAAEVAWNRAGFAVEWSQDARFNT